MDAAGLVDERGEGHDLRGVGAYGPLSREYGGSHGPRPKHREQAVAFGSDEHVSVAAAPGR